MKGINLRLRMIPKVNVSINNKLTKICPYKSTLEK